MADSGWRTLSGRLGWLVAVSLFVSMAFYALKLFHVIVPLPEPLPPDASFVDNIIASFAHDQAHWIENLVSSVFLAVGFGGHGFQHSPATGRYVAEWLLDGRSSLDLSLFDQSYRKPGGKLLLYLLVIQHSVCRVDEVVRVENGSIRPHGRVRRQRQHCAHDYQ